MSNLIENFKVTDRQSFIGLIDLLHEGLLMNPDSWENKTLPDFLSALSSYAEDIQGYYDNTKQDINADNADWGTFSDIFKGARIYE